MDPYITLGETSQRLMKSLYDSHLYVESENKSRKTTEQEEPYRQRKQVAVREKISGLMREIDERDGEVKTSSYKIKCITGMKCTVWRIL